MIICKKVSNLFTFSKKKYKQTKQIDIFLHCFQFAGYIEVCSEGDKPFDFGEVNFNVKDARAVEITVTLSDGEKRKYRVSKLHQHHYEGPEKHI